MCVAVCVCAAIVHHPSPIKREREMYKEHTAIPIIRCVVCVLVSQRHQHPPTTTTIDKSACPFLAAHSHTALHARTRTARTHVSIYNNIERRIQSLSDHASLSYRAPCRDLIYISPTYARVTLRAHSHTTNETPERVSLSLSLSHYRYTI